MNSISKLAVDLSLNTSAIADELQRVGEAFIAAAQQIRGGQSVAARGNPIAAHHDVIPALIQTELSQRLLPGEWLLVNLQINGAELITELDYWRVRLNTGCGPQGELDGHPMAHRGFEQADTPAELARLALANSTSRVYDVIKEGDVYVLDTTKPLIEAAGIKPIKAHPKVHAVRVVSWEALDGWVRDTAAGRPNRAD